MTPWSPDRPVTVLREPSQESSGRRQAEDEWLWGWDPRPGIVSVWAEGDGWALVWRRIVETGELACEGEHYRPWMLLDRLHDLRHLGERLAPEGTTGAFVSYRELDGAGELRYLVSADDGRALAAAVLEGATRRLGRRVSRLQELGKDAVLALPPEEQYLVATGRTYFRNLSFDQLRRMQFDLETTGLDAERDRIFMIAVRHPSGATEVLEASGDGDGPRVHASGLRGRRGRLATIAVLRLQVIIAGRGSGFAAGSAYKASLSLGHAANRVDSIVL